MIELIAPIVGHLLHPSGRTIGLRSSAPWLIEHNRALEVGVFAIFGGRLMPDGVTRLIG
jgi:hypothetical protein